MDSGEEGGIILGRVYLQIDEGKAGGLHHDLRGETGGVFPVIAGQGDGDNDLFVNRNRIEHAGGDDQGFAHDSPELNEPVELSLAEIGPFFGGDSLAKGRYVGSFDKIDAGRKDGTVAVEVDAMGFAEDEIGFAGDKRLEAAVERFLGAGDGGTTDGGGVEQGSKGNGGGETGHWTPPLAKVLASRMSEA